MKFIDSHAHLLDARFDEDREQVMRELQEEGIAYVVECASAPGDFDEVIALTRRFEMVYGALGVHPEAAEEYSPDVEGRIARLSAERKIVAVGEIGLDYHYEIASRTLQREVLAAQLSLADRLGLPVILHSREATSDMLETLEAAPRVRGVMHCYSGSVETMKRLLKWDFYFGFGGSLTFKNNKKTVEAAAYAPLERILIETDSPYLAPVPMRGKRNTPAYVRYVAEKLAEIKGISTEEIARQTYLNAQRLFEIE